MNTLQNWFRKEISKTPLQPASRGSTILPRRSQGHKNNLYARDMCRVTDIGIWKSEFVANTKFINNKISGEKIKFIFTFNM